MKATFYAPALCTCDVPGALLPYPPPPPLHPPPPPPLLFHPWTPVASLSIIISWLPIPSDNSYIVSFWEYFYLTLEIKPTKHFLWTSILLPLMYLSSWPSSGEKEKHSRKRSVTEMGEGRNCICYVEEKIGGGKSAPGASQFQLSPHLKITFGQNPAKTFLGKNNLHLSRMISNWLCLVKTVWLKLFQNSLKLDPDWRNSPMAN